MKVNIIWFIILVSINMLIIGYNNVTHAKKEQLVSNRDISFKRAFIIDKRAPASTIEAFKSFKEYCQKQAGVAGPGVMGLYYEKPFEADIDPYIEVGCNINDRDFSEALFTKEVVDMFSKLCKKEEKDKMGIRVYLGENRQGNRITVFCHRFL